MRMNGLPEEPVPFITTFSPGASISQIGAEEVPELVTTAPLVPAVTVKVPSVTARVTVIEPDPASASLTEREIEVLRLLSSGMDNAEIGRTLFISPSTVKNHISSILLKLQIENRIQAAVYAVRSGLV